MERIVLTEVNELESGSQLGIIDSELRRTESRLELRSESINYN